MADFTNGQLLEECGSLKRFVSCIKKMANGSLAPARDNDGPHLLPVYGILRVFKIRRESDE